MTFDLIGPIAYASFFLVLALVNALVCLGLNVQWGQTGLFNVGIAGFVAIGAYASALLTTPPVRAVSAASRCRSLPAGSPRWSLRAQPRLLSAR